MRLPPICKATLSWLVVVVGTLFGLCILGVSGMRSAPFGERSSGWFTIAGVGLLGVCFVAGSILAPRDRRRAGVIFLAFAPMTAFCLAYPNSGFLVWHADGSGWFETPTPLTAIGLAILFFAPFLAVLLARRNRKRAAVLFGITVLIAVLVFSMTRWTSVLVPRLAGWSAPFALFASFWLRTDKLGWPSLIQPHHRSVGQRTGVVVIACLAVLCADVTATLILSALTSSLFSGDCGEKPPFTHPQSPSHAVFTARVLFVGPSIQSLIRTPSVFRRVDSPKAKIGQVGIWAIGVVQERFWGLPSWEPHLVLLTNSIYWKGETYFIDGDRAHGLLTQVLPIVSGGIGCSRTRPAFDAVVDLRLLHEAPSASGRRLIGYVREPEVFRGALSPPTPPGLASGARIDVTGPTGTKTITTDQSGIYQIDGLPPGEYMLQLSVPAGQTTGFFGSEGSSVRVHLGTNGLVEHNFYLFWNGQIEGHVKDDSGKPAHIWVLLRSADGSTLPGNVRDFLLTNSDGSYQINKIPPGHYIVMVNPYGPTQGAPYSSIYYPSAVRPEDAGVLALSDGQDIKNIDFFVTRLVERKLPVRVMWATGRPAEGAWLYAAYDDTSAVADLQSAHAADTGARTDENGVSNISVFGDSRVRVFAEEVLNDLTTRYSAPVELRGDNLPSHLNLLIDISESRMQTLWRETSSLEVRKTSR